MTATKEGGLKAKKHNLKRTELYIDGKSIKIKPGTMYQVIGQAGGSAPKTKPTGFQLDRELASRAGTKGGLASGYKRRTRSV